MELKWNVKLYELVHIEKIVNCLEWGEIYLTLTGRGCETRDKEAKVPLSHNDLKSQQKYRMATKWVMFIT